MITVSFTVLVLLNGAFAQGISVKSFSFSQTQGIAADAHPGQQGVNEILHAGVSPQDTVSVPTPAPEPPVLAYLHIYGGMGFSYVSASEINALLGDDFGIGIGLPTWAWGFIGGYKNIVQVEYNNGISDHNFNKNSIIADVPSEVIEMDYNTTDWHFKFNPLFWNMEPNSAIYLIYGMGDVEWKDTNNDGFTGTSQIFGLEYANITKYVSWSVSFKRYGITFDETRLFNIPFDVKTEASDYILEFKGGVGLGI